MENLDCCEQYEFKLYGKRSSSSGITDTELRASPIVVKQEKASSGVYKSNFTTTTPSSLIGTSTYQNVRKAFTVFNEGPANLYIGVGSPTTTTEYQVRLSAGDYWECPAVQIGILHTAVFSSAGTARVVEVW
jgi:5-hydroxyisourate hydrolase-like protein (transthyretin family)